MVLYHGSNVEVKEPRILMPSHALDFGLIMMMVAVAAAMPLMAETEKVGDYTWTYRISGGTAGNMV